MSNFFDVCISYERIERWLQGGIVVRRRMTPGLWLLMIVTTAMIFSVSLGVLQHQYTIGARELERIEDYRDELDLKVRDLSDALDYAQTDAFIIRMARDELNWIMPGEVRYINGAG